MKYLKKIDELSGSDIIEKIDELHSDISSHTVFESVGAAIGRIVLEDKRVCEIQILLSTNQDDFYSENSDYNE